MSTSTSSCFSASSAFAALLGSVVLFAQSSRACAQTAANGDSVVVGAGVLVVPKYPGSGKRDARLLPVLNMRYGRVFLGPVPASRSPLGLGIDLYRERGLRAGAAITTDIRKLRTESDAARLTGLGDIKGTQRLNVFASYSIDRYTLRSNVASDIGGNRQGTLATVEFDTSFRLSDALTLAVGPSVTWASRAYSQTVFGISATQSAASGLPAFNVGCGVNMAQLSAMMHYQFNQNWGLGGRISIGRLQGDAADSPITEQRSQSSAALFATYRF
jgi:outer membrane protein